MPNLVSELRRFESAKFGADVKDSFISCVRKIHAENEGYQQLKEDAVAAADVVRKQAEAIQKSVEAARGGRNPKKEALRQKFVEAARGGRNPKKGSVEAAHGVSTPKQKSEEGKHRGEKAM